MARVLANDLETVNVLLPLAETCDRAWTAAPNRLDMGVLAALFRATLIERARACVLGGSRTSRTELELRAQSCTNSFAVEGAFAHRNGGISVAGK